MDPLLILRNRLIREGWCKLSFKGCWEKCRAKYKKEVIKTSGLSS
ncbi:hypothetical protein ACSAZK_03110 [Methanosarcina sp. Mfa9]